MKTDKLTAVITGANKGIGFEIARQLGQRGVRVILTARDEAKGKAAAEKLKQGNADVEFHALDVSEPQSIEAFGKSMQNSRVDILVNNAGIFGPLSGVAEAGMDDFHKVLETNLFGQVHVTKVLLPLL